MKKIILIYILHIKTIVFLCATADNNFNWSGMLSDFVVSTENDIRLNANSSGKSYLNTQSERCLNTQWEFDVQLAFNPSSSNYMDIYLCSENDSLTENTKGYFIRIGYTNDNICLYRKEGSKITRLIEGTKKRLDYPSVRISIKITCSSEAVWQLYAKVNGEDEYLEEGNCVDFFHFDVKFFGLLCVYTTTRSQDFRFSKLTISNIDESIDEHEFNLERPTANDVIFNEIRFNGIEYIEFYNRSSKSIDLSQLYFVIRRNNGNLSSASFLSPYPKPMNPGTFIVLMKNKDSFCSAFSCDVEIVESEKMPQLNNAGANLVLMNIDDEIIDEFVYSEKMHQALIANKKEIALERINPDLPTQDATNWQTASYDSGYGTPGTINSQYLNNDSAMKFELTKDVFRFCGYEEELFEYVIPEAGTNALILLFDSQGRIVKKLANNVLLGTSGSFFWDGLDDNKNSCETGIYIVYIETISLQGTVFKTKKAFTILK